MSFVSRIQYYQDIDAYFDTYKGFLRAVDAFVNDNKTEESRDDLKECFVHKNIKTVYPSMKYYENNRMDYTLLILENITTDEEIYHFVNEVMQEELPLNDKFDKILKNIFNSTSPELRYSLGAIRSGRSEIDFSEITRKGF